MGYGTIAADLMTTSTAGGTLGAGNATGFKNRIINGAMMIDQRNAGASVTLNGTNNVYPVDRFASFATVGTVTGQQSTSAPDNSGLINSIVYTVSATGSLGTTGTVRFAQYIEGLNVADLGWGTAYAKTVTLSFWVKSSLTGTFGGAIRNSANDRCYVFSYSISSANTWEQKTITIVGDTTGTWLTTNGVGIRIFWSLGSGSSYQGSAGSWGSSLLYSVTGETTLVTNSGATLYITGVQLEVGPSASSFEVRDYTKELQLCQRYCITNFNGSWGETIDSTRGIISVRFPVTMRATPSFFYLSGSSTNVDVIGQQKAATVQNNGGGPNSYGLLVGGMSGLTTWQAYGFSDGNQGMSAEL